MQNTRMRTKDIITVVLLSLINIVIFGFGTFFYLTPFTILLMPIFYSLFQGMVFFMIGAKVQKKGAFLLYSVIQGVVGFNIPYIIMWVISGFICEIILSRTGFTSVKGLTLSYIIQQLLAAIGSTIYPYAITLETTLSRMDSSTGDLCIYVEKAGHMIMGWGMLVLVIGIVIAAWLGALLGARVMKRHVLKSGE